MEFHNEPVTVTATITAGGEVFPTEVSWAGQMYPIIEVGRQWDEDEGRHVLVEAANGARFDVQLSKADLVWRVKRVWPASEAA